MHLIIKRKQSNKPRENKKNKEKMLQTVKKKKKRKTMGNKNGFYKIVLEKKGTLMD